MYRNYYCISETPPVLDRYIEEANRGKMYGLPVALGDTEAMVRATLGEPTGISRALTGSNFRYWSFKNNCLRYMISFRSGVVTSILKYTSEITYQQVPDIFIERSSGRKKIPVNGATLVISDRYDQYVRNCAPTAIVLTVR